MAVTYLDFHLYFVAPPVALLVLVAGARLDVRRRIEWAGIGLLIGLALLYTIPWDNYLIGQGVWEYGPDTVAMRIGLAPIEEYLFIALQTVVTGLWLYLLSPLEGTVSVTRRDRLVGLGAGLLVGLVGIVLLLGAGTYYLGAIALWAAPVLALQWGVGWPYLWRHRRRLAFGTLVPTLYFASADRFALETGIWSLSARHTTGIAIAGLPIEEGAFFLVTNLFVVQGLLLYAWVLRR